MFATLIRHAARDAHVGDAAQVGSAAVILRILKEHGPCNKEIVWKYAEVGCRRKIGNFAEQHYRIP